MSETSAPFPTFTVTAPPGWFGPGPGTLTITRTRVPSDERDEITALVDAQLGLDAQQRHECGNCRYWWHRPFAECPECGWQL